MQRRQRVVHPERVGARERVRGERVLDVRQARNDERAHVHVRGDPDTGGVRQRVQRAPRLIGERLGGAQRVERGDGRRVDGDGAGVADGDALAGEIGFRRRVHRRGPRERLIHDDRVARIGGVQFLQRRQPLLDELRGVPAAHRRDEPARGHRLRPGPDQRLHVRNRACGLEPRVVSRSQAEQHDVIVVVDQAGNGGAALQVNNPGARAQASAALADAGDDPVLNRHLGDDGVLRVHRRDLAVDESDVPRARTVRGRRRLRGRSRCDERCEYEYEWFHGCPVCHVIVAGAQG